MASYQPPKKGVEWIGYIALVDQADTKKFKVNPTIASGDFKVSIDGGAFANLNTLPVVTPSGGIAVKITLSTSEMNGDNVFVQCVDAAGAEWCDLSFNLQTSARQIDDLQYVTQSLGTESYAADGAVPTVAQMQFMLWSFLQSFRFDGTVVKTSRKLDNVSTAMTHTIDSTSNPQEIERTS